MKLDTFASLVQNKIMGTVCWRIWS